MYCDCIIDGRFMTRQKFNKKKKTKPKTIQTYLDDERRLSQKKGILYVRNHLPKSNQKKLKLLQAKYKLIPEVVKNLKKSLKN